MTEDATADIRRAAKESVARECEREESELPTDIRNLLNNNPPTT